MSETNWQEKMGKRRKGRAKERGGFRSFRIHMLYIINNSSNFVYIIQHL